jgi:hypothetical protein
MSILPCSVSAVYDETGHTIAYVKKIYFCLRVSYMHIVCIAAGEVTALGCPVINARSRRRKSRSRFC